MLYIFVKIESLIGLERWLEIVFVVHSIHMVDYPKHINVLCLNMKLILLNYSNVLIESKHLESLERLKFSSSDLLIRQILYGCEHLFINHSIAASLVELQQDFTHLLIVDNKLEKYFESK